MSIEAGRYRREQRKAQGARKGPPSYQDQRALAQNRVPARSGIRAYALSLLEYCSCSDLPSAPLPAVQASTLVSEFAAWIASRSEQSPSLFSSSFVVVTVMPVAFAK